MNPSQEKMIAEMGLGPVWKLRTNPVEQTFLTQSLPSMNTSSAPRIQTDLNEQIESENDVNSLANNSVCRTCEWNLVSSSRARSVQATDVNYLFIYDCAIDSDQAFGCASAADQLMDSILRELRVKIGVNAYVAGIVKTKFVKVGGRQFHGQERAVYHCLSCLKKQIEIIRPAVIVSLGNVAAIELLSLDANTALAALRGELHRYNGMALVVTHALSHLVRQPEEKRGLWSDLCFAMSVT